MIHKFNSLRNLLLVITIFFIQFPYNCFSAVTADNHDEPNCPEAKVLYNIGKNVTSRNQSYVGLREWNCLLKCPKRGYTSAIETGKMKIQDILSSSRCICSKDSHCSDVNANCVNQTCICKEGYANTIELYDKTQARPGDLNCTPTTTTIKCSNTSASIMEYVGLNQDQLKPVKCTDKCPSNTFGDIFCQCKSDAHCAAIKDAKCTWKICDCKDGFVLNANRTKCLETLEFQNCVLNEGCPKLIDNVCNKYEDSWVNENKIWSNNGRIYNTSECNVVARMESSEYGYNLEMSCFDDRCTCKDSGLLMNRFLNQTCSCPVGFVGNYRHNGCVLASSMIGRICVSDKDCPYNIPCIGARYFQEDRYGACVPNYATNEKMEQLRSSCKAKDQFGEEWLGKLQDHSIKKCPFNSTGEAEWYCQPDGTFYGKTPNYQNCRSEWISRIQRVINGNLVIESKLNLQLAQQIQQNLTTQNYFGPEIKTIGNLLWNITLKLPSNQTEETGIKVLDYVITIIDLLFMTEKQWDQLYSDYKHLTFGYLISLLEKIPLTLAECVNKCAQPGVCFRNKKVSDYQIQVGAIGGFPIILGFNNDGKHSSINVTLSYEDGRYFTGNIVPTDKYSKQIESIEVKNELSPCNISIPPHKYLPNSPLLSLATDKILDKKVFSFPLKNPAIISFANDQFAWGTEIIEIRRHLHSGEKPAGVMGSTMCAYWDYTNSSWSTDGCIVLSVSEFETTCSCNHLSSFTMFQKVHKYIGKSRFLVILSFLLGLAYIVYALIKSFIYKKYEHEYIDSELIKPRPEILKKFGLTLTFLCYGVVMFLVDRNYFYFLERTCYRIGILGHFFILVVVIIFSVECFLSTMDYAGKTSLAWLLNASKTGKTSIYSYIIFPGTLSLIIVITTVVIDQLDGGHSRAYGGAFCFPNGKYIMALFGPLWGCLTLNFCFFAYLMWKSRSYIFNKDSKVMTGSGRNVKIDEVVEFVQKGFLSNILITVTWIVGYFNFDMNYQRGSWMDFLFAILLSFQGVVMEKLLGDNGCFSWIKKLVRKLIIWILPKIMTWKCWGLEATNKTQVAKNNISLKNLGNRANKNDYTAPPLLHVGEPMLKPDKGQQ